MISYLCYPTSICIFKNQRENIYFDSFISLISDNRLHSKNQLLLCYLDQQEKKILRAIQNGTLEYVLVHTCKNWLYLWPYSCSIVREKLACTVKIYCSYATLINKEEICFYLEQYKMVPLRIFRTHLLKLVVSVAI